MLIPFTPAQQKVVRRLINQHRANLSLIAESMGIEEVIDVHPECVGFIVPDPPGFVPPASPESTSVAPEKE